MNQPECVGRWLFPWRKSMFWVRTAVATIFVIILLSTARLFDFGRDDPIHLARLHLHNDIAKGHQTTPTTGRESSQSLFPRKIWQIMLPKNVSEDSPIHPEQLPDTISWLAMNPDYA
jgi:hypothetical protein